MPKRLINIGEFGLINALEKNIKKGRGVIKGIGDDTAVIDCGAWKWLLITTDMLVEDVHFFKNTEPQDIGYKALAVNISDIAAMGGVPTFAVISLGLIEDLEVDYVKKIYEGINQLAKTYKIAIVGGDTVKSSKLIINITLLGEVNKNELVSRKGARVGDIIFVSGALGRAWKNDKHLCFTPRLKEAQYLVKKFSPSSMIDISDGLLIDMGHILKQSHVGAVLYEEDIPLAVSAELDEALSDGEDFELLFTLSARQAKKLEKTKSKKHLFYRIGEIVPSKEKFKMRDALGREVELKTKGYTHF